MEFNKLPFEGIWTCALP